MSDLISRQAAIETVRKAKSIGQAHRMLVQLPSAQPVVISKSENTTECEDTVSKEAVSSWLKQYGQDVLHGKYKFSLMYIWKKLMDLPSVTPKQPGWIPCTPETMPKEDGQYIVTVKYEHVDGYDDIYSEHGEWVDGHWDAECGHCGRVEKVLAWQPLPTPYREGGQS